MKQHNVLRQSIQRIVPKSLRARLMLVQGIVSICIFVLIGGVTYNFARNRESEMWRSRQAEAARNAAQTIGIVIEETHDVINWVSALEPAYLLDAPDVLQGLLRREDFLSELVWLDTAGRPLVSAYRDQAVLSNLFTIQQSTWFRQARQGNAYLSAVQMTAQDRPYLIIALPDQDQGVVVARLKMDVLWHVVEDIHFGQSGHVYVVNRDGLVIAHTDTTIVTSQTNIATRPEFMAMTQAARNEWHGSYENLQGNAVVGATALIPGTDWIVFAEISQDEAFATSRAALIFLVTGVFSFLLIGNLITRHSFDMQIVRPLNQLRQGALQIGQGALTHRIAIDTPTELRDLADTFNEMAEQLLRHETEIRTYTEQLEMEIAERKRAGQSLRILEKALQTMNLGVTVSDVNGNIIYTNPADARMHGYTAEELIGKPARVFADSSRINTPDREKLKIWTTSWQREIDNIRKDGSTFPAFLISDTVTDTDGEPIGIVTTCQDITERKQAEEALRHAKENLEIRVQERTAELADANRHLAAANARMNHLLTSSPIVIYSSLVESDYRATFMSDNVQRILGYPAEQFVQDPQFWIGNIHPEDVPHVLSGMEFLIKQETYIDEYRFKKSDGSYRWVRDFTRLIHDTEGKPIELIGAWMDITEQRQAEEKLRILSRAVEQSPVSIVITDTTGAIEYANPKFSQVTGYTIEEAIGKNPRILKSGQTPLDVYDELWRKLTQGVEWHGEFVNRKKNGELYYESASISPITDARNNTTHYLAVKEDITDRKRNEQALTKHAQEMEMLYATSLEASAQTDLPSVLQTIIHRATELVGGDLGSLHLLNDDHTTLHLIVGHNLPNVAMIGTTQKLGEGIAGQVAQSGQAVIVTNYARSKHRARPYSEMQIQRVLGVPLQVQGKIIGAIVIGNRLKSEAFTEEELHLVRLFADQAALVVDRARLYADIQRLAITDELTQIYNRRGLFQFGEREVERALRFNHPLAAVMFDIDRFKTVNDTYSHAIGDKVLQAVAQAAQHNARRLDLLGRYGGEEFVWLIPEADLASAASAAERLRQSIEEIEFPANDHSIRVTVSLGVAQATERTLDLATLIDQADLAMLRAKASGRNRVAMSD